MAQCLITTSWNCPSCDEKFSIPGIQKDTIWLANRSEISAYSDGLGDKEIDAITFDTYKGLYKICVYRDSASFTEELQSETSYYYNQTFTCRTIDDTNEVAQSIEDLVGGDIVIIFKQKNNKFKIAGKSFGLRMSTQMFETGAAAGDSFGNTLTFTGEELGKAFFMLDTDADTTQALLESYEV